MKPLSLQNVEFYITNVCNFNCDGCNRFNNINFSGSQKWADFGPVYKKWAEYVDVGNFTILGGEPMTNPDYMDWLEGVSCLWPNSTGQLLTNGHYLKANNHRLYDILKNSNQRLTLEIGLHNEDRLSSVRDTVSNFLKGELTVSRLPNDLREVRDIDVNWAYSYNQIKDPSWPECNTVDAWETLPEYIKQECLDVHQVTPDILGEPLRHWVITDTNGVTVRIMYENYFSHGSLIFDQDSNRITLPHSDPVVAHTNCSFAIAKCYHFIKGKLYKCGPVALFPELDAKFGLDLTPQDKKIIHSYRPGDVEEDSLDQLTEFVNMIDHPIDQCKFCPESFPLKKIFAEHGKKIIILKPIRKESQP